MSEQKQNPDYVVDTTFNAHLLSLTINMSVVASLYLDCTCNCKQYYRITFQEIDYAQDFR